ncbi:MAG: GGDEF domain-containing protein [Acidimicrobiales bacterium]
MSRPTLVNMGSGDDDPDDGALARFITLFSLVERLSRSESASACAAAASFAFRGLASVAAWRLLIEEGDGFLAVDFDAGTASVDHVDELTAWDRWCWERLNPVSLGQGDTPEPPPPHRCPTGIGEIRVVPYHRPGLPKGTFVASTRETAFTGLDDRFMRMAARLLYEQLGGIIVRDAQISRLEADSWRDGLTGLANRRSILETLAKQLSNGARYHEPVTLLMVDIDGFTELNARHGHRAGDAVLTELAGRLQRAARDGDYVGRYGGDEFVAILLRCDANGAYLAAERVRADVAAAPFEVPGDAGLVQLDVRVSVGAASTSDRPSLAPLELIVWADRGLAAARAAGADRAVVTRADGPGHRHLTVVPVAREGSP